MIYGNKKASTLCSITQDDLRVMGGRSGTLYAKESDLVKLFGKPQDVNSFDEKVTKRWVIVTPRGPVEVRDYWWNAPGEWSIASAGRADYKWAIRFLRSHGLIANRRMGSAAVA